MTFQILLLFFRWVVPNGCIEGQTLSVRKTSLSNYPGDVLIHIKNQDLSSPNVQSFVFVMTPNMYALSWCWDGSWWLLESVGQAKPQYTPEHSLLAPNTVSSSSPTSSNSGGSSSGDGEGSSSASSSSAHNRKGIRQ